MSQLAGASPRSRWYHGWNIVAVCALSMILVTGLPNFSFSLFLKDWVSEFHTRISFLQLGFSIMGVMCALWAPVVGLMSDRLPIRLVIGMGLGCITLMCFAISFATSAWQIVVIYSVLLPVAIDCGAGIPANAVVSRWFVRRLGLAMGLTAFGVALAGIIVPPLVASLLPALGWRTVWRLGGLITGVVLAPIVLLVLRNRPTERDGLEYLTGAGAAPPHHGSGGAGALTWQDVFKRKNFWLLVVVTLPMVGSYTALMPNLAPILAARGFGQQTAGVLLAMFSVANLIANLLAGLLSDRIGNRLPLLALAVLTAAGCLCVGFGESLPILALGAVLVGLNGGIWPLAGAATALEFGSEGFGRAFGLLALFLPVSVVTTVIIARVEEITGSYAPAFSAIAAITLVCGMFVLLMRERRGNLAAGSEGAVSQ